MFLDTRNNRLLKPSKALAELLNVCLQQMNDHLAHKTRCLALSDKLEVRRYTIVSLFLALGLLFCNLGASQLKMKPLIQSELYIYLTITLADFDNDSEVFSYQFKSNL